MKILYISLLMVSLNGYSQRVAVHTVEDSRSTGDGYFSNRCKVEFRISGDEARRYSFARLLSIDKAEDDLGHDLIRENESMSNDYQKKEDTYFTVSVDLLNPSRKAETIAEIAGEMRLFSPTEANGGKVVIKNFAKKPGVNLLPATSPVSLSYMNKEAVMKYNKDSEEKREEELAKMPEEMAAGMRELLDIFSGIFSGGDTDNTVYFMAAGDTDRLVSLRFIDAEGKEINNSGYTQSGNTWGYFMNEPVKENWGIEVSIEAAAAVKDVRFSVKGVELP